MRFLFFRLFGLIFLLSVLDSCSSSKDAPKGPVSGLVMDTTEQVIIWHYEDEFSAGEKQKLEAWITFVSECAQRVLGEYPFDLNYFFHRVDSSDRAVVFGHTGRTLTFHGAHFYVDPTYPEEDFRNDWIGPHEVSHLALPKLGKPNAWFFEGFATYMSRKVMMEMGTITEAEADSTFEERISAMTWAYENSSSNFITVADSLVANHHLYPEMYWGGASYWHRAEKMLEEQGKNPLVNVLKYFQSCCHEADLNLDETVARFDAISQSSVFSDLLYEYRNLPAKEVLISYQ